MPYDPALPATGSPNSSAEMHGQINGLKDISDAVPAGQPAGVTVNVIGNTLHLTFDIPQGAQGTAGSNGTDGTPGGPGGTGPQGETGPAGEVTNATLAAAVSGNSAQTNGVAELAGPFADPDPEALRAKVNEMLLAMRR